LRVRAVELRTEKTERIRKKEKRYRNTEKCELLNGSQCEAGRKQQCCYGIKPGANIRGGGKTFTSSLNLFPNLAVERGGGGRSDASYSLPSPPPYSNLIRGYFI
jgi:hypothetical protein